MLAPLIPLRLVVAGLVLQTQKQKEVVDQIQSCRQLPLRVVVEVEVVRLHQPQLLLERMGDLAAVQQEMKVLTPLVRLVLETLHLQIHLKVTTVVRQMPHIAQEVVEAVVERALLVQPQLHLLAVMEVLEPHHQ